MQPASQPVPQSRSIVQQALLVSRSSSAWRGSELGTGRPDRQLVRLEDVEGMSRVYASPSKVDFGNAHHQIRQAIEYQWCFKDTNKHPNPMHTPENRKYIRNMVCMV